MTETLLERLRALHSPACWLGVSQVGSGVWSLRWIAADNLRLREAIQRVRTVLAELSPELRTNLRKV